VPTDACIGVGRWRESMPPASAPSAGGVATLRHLLCGFGAADEPATGCHRRILEKNPVFPFKFINYGRSASAEWGRIHSFVQAYNIGSNREPAVDRRELLTKRESNHRSLEDIGPTKGDQASRRYVRGLNPVLNFLRILEFSESRSKFRTRARARFLETLFGSQHT
jgi:hypothetical protein